MNTLSMDNFAQVAMELKRLKGIEEEHEAMQKEMLRQASRYNSLRLLNTELYAELKKLRSEKHA